MDPELLRSVLKSKSADARAAATHVVADERDYLSAAQELLAPDGIGGKLQQPGTDAQVVPQPGRGEAPHQPVQDVALNQRVPPQGRILE